MTSDSHAKAVIEAALFASGRTLTARELAKLSGLSEERARALADGLAAEYVARGSGIEIKSIGEGYSMQVRFGLAGSVLSFAPKEIEAPLSDRYIDYPPVIFTSSSPDQRFFAQLIHQTSRIGRFLHHSVFHLIHRYCLAGSTKYSQYVVLGL